MVQQNKIVLSVSQERPKVNKFFQENQQVASEPKNEPSAECRHQMAEKTNKHLTRETTELAPCKLK